MALVTRWKHCSVDGCENPHKATGYCNSHYMRHRRYGNPLGGNKTNWLEPLEFARSLVGRTDKECIIWPYAGAGKGYGKIRINGRSTGAHRLVCSLSHGDPSSDRLMALHSCNNGKGGCVNPNHLRWGTYKENFVDAVKDGSASIGDRHYRTKISDHDVLAIRALRGVEPRVETAEKYGTTASYIALIQQGHSRKRVGRPA